MASILEPSLLPLHPSLPSKKAQLQNAFAQLDLHRSALALCILQWNELQDYLSDVERSVEAKLGDLAEKEKSLEAKAKATQAALDAREEAIAAREKASLARVQEQKETAIAAIVEEKRKWNEERQRSESEASACTAKAGKAAAVDLALENHVSQVKKEGVAASDGSIAVSSEKDSGSSKPADGPAAAGASASSKEDSANQASIKDGSPPPASKSSDPKVRQQLKVLCENMDGDGLRKYMVERRKDVISLRSELPFALKSAIDPARLALSALEGYYFPEQGTNQGGEKKESGISANRRACILLLECLGQVLSSDPSSGSECSVVSSNVRDLAKELADQWNSKMNLPGDALASNSLDAQAFLQLLVTFDIASEYKEEELCKLVTAVARRRQTPALCRSLGLTAKMPEIVDRLASDGKQIEAISLAHAFNIMDRIQPAPLLKAYLKEARKSAQSILKSGSNSTAAQNESTTRELSALKNALKCIEEFELESQFPSSPLQKRVAQLEKTKSDRKRVAVAVKAQAKRPRANGVINVPTHGTTVPAERVFYRPPERPQYGAVTVTPYSLGLPSNFERSRQANYGSVYGGGNRNPVALPSSYIYSTESMGSAVYGSAAYGNPPTYGSYQFGSGLTPPPAAYQTPFLH